MQHDQQHRQIEPLRVSTADRQKFGLVCVEKMTLTALLSCCAEQYSTSSGLPWAASVDQAQHLTVSDFLTAVG